MNTESENTTADPKKEPLSMLEQIACILIPLIGIVLYFIFVAKDEKKAKFALQLSIFGLVLSSVLYYMLFM